MAKKHTIKDEIAYLAIIAAGKLLGQNAPHDIDHAMQLLPNVFSELNSIDCPCLDGLTAKKEKAEKPVDGKTSDGK